MLQYDPHQIQQHCSLHFNTQHTLAMHLIEWNADHHWIGQDPSEILFWDKCKSFHWTFLRSVDFALPDLPP